MLLDGTQDPEVRESLFKVRNKMLLLTRCYRFLVATDILHVNGAFAHSDFSLVLLKYAYFLHILTMS